jgi:hypothetical protein
VDENMVIKGSYSMAKRSFVCIISDAKEARRELVELLGGGLPKIKLGTPRPVPVGTNVTIQSGRDKAVGVVTTCFGAKSRHEISVEIKRGGQWLLDLVPAASYYDPGVHSVNEFISDKDLVQLINQLVPKNHTVGLHK